MVIYSVGRTGLMWTWHPKCAQFRSKLVAALNEPYPGETAQLIMRVLQQCSNCTHGDAQLDRGMYRWPFDNWKKEGLESFTFYTCSRASFRKNGVYQLIFLENKMHYSCFADSLENSVSKGEFKMRYAKSCQVINCDTGNNHLSQMKWNFVLTCSFCVVTCQADRHIYPIYHH